MPRLSPKRAVAIALVWPSASCRLCVPCSISPPPRRSRRGHVHQLPTSFLFLCFCRCLCFASVLPRTASVASARSLSLPHPPPPMRLVALAARRHPPFQYAQGACVQHVSACSLSPVACFEYQWPCGAGMLCIPLDPPEREIRPWHTPASVRAGRHCWLGGAAGLRGGVEGAPRV